jgi:hypothetical protein
VKNICTLILAILLFSLEVKSQSYTNAVGLSLGTYGGLSYRKIMSSDLAGELQLASYHHGTVLTFLAEKYRPMLIHDHFPVTFLYGVGVHVGAGRVYNHDNWFANCNDDHYNNYRYSPRAGIDGFACLEYEVDRYPVAVSLECKPFIEFFDFGFPGLHLPAITASIRYTF